MVGFLESGWLPLSFLNRKKLVVLGLDGPSAVLDSGTLRQLHQIFFLSLPGGPKVIWICSHLWSHLQVGYHHLPIAWEVCHRSNFSSAPLHDLGESSLERKVPIFANALRGRCPSPIQFLYQPSVIGIVLDLVHQAPSHCFNIHPKSSAHHPRLCQYQNCIPVLQDNLARIWWHRVRGCNPYIQHVSTQLNAISNFGKSLHL